MEQTAAADSNTPVGGRGRRTAWNVSAVAGQETTAVTPPIMGGAATWPSLSSNRFSPKSSTTPSSSSDDLKSMSDGSSSAVSASVIQKSSASPESVLVQAASAAAPPPQPKPTSNPNPNPNPATNRHNPNPNNRSSNKWHNNNNNNNNNNRRNNYNNNYNNNFRPREKGPNWNNSNNNWNNNNNNNNSNGNGNNSLHQRPQNFYRPNPAVAAPPVSFGFAAPPVHQAFYPPMGFAEYPFQVMSPVPLMAPQFMPQIPMVLSTGEVERRNAILTQIEYYFSTENLCKDVYLRKNMDEQGWVPISLIAGFNRVKQLTTDMQYILDVIQGSLILEVQGDKIRSRNNWMNWVFTDRMQGLNINTTPLTTAHNIIL